MIDDHQYRDIPTDTQTTRLKMYLKAIYTIKKVTRSIFTQVQIVQQSDGNQQLTMLNCQYDFTTILLSERLFIPQLEHFFIRKKIAKSI